MTAARLDTLKPGDPPVTLGPRPRIKAPFPTRTSMVRKGFIDEVGQVLPAAIEAAFWMHATEDR